MDSRNRCLFLPGRSKSVGTRSTSGLLTSIANCCRRPPTAYTWHHAARNTGGTCFIICDSTSKSFVPGSNDAPEGNAFLQRREDKSLSVVAVVVAALTARYWLFDLSGPSSCR